MLVFGGKLINKSKVVEEEIDLVDAQKTALKSLSKQEKLLLLELQRTRQSIVDELQRLDPVLASGSWYEVQDTIKGYKSKIANDLQVPVRIEKRNKKNANVLSSVTHGNMGSSARIATQSLDTSIVKANKTTALSSLRTGIDMLPILATDGQAVLEVGIKRQGKIKLPVFKLPSLDMDKVNSILFQKEAEDEFATIPVSQNTKTKPTTPLAGARSGVAQQINSTQTSTTKKVVYKKRPMDPLVPYHDKISFMIALGSMSNMIPKWELRFVKSYLHMTDGDVNDIEDAIIQAEMDRSGSLLLKMMNTSKKVKDNSIDSIDTGIPTISVFAKAKLIWESSRQTFGTFASDDANSIDMQSTSSSTGMMLQGSMMQGSMHGLMTPSSIMQGSMFSERKSTRGTGGFGNFDNTSVSNASRRSTKSHKSTKSTKANKVKTSEDEANELKMELLKSLRNMQKHTELVKDGIINVNEIVQVNNPKARAIMTAMSAEKLRAAIWRLVEKELKRGWNAWMIEFKRQKVGSKIVQYVRFQSMRQIASALGRLAHRALEIKYVRWYNYATKESARIRRERELKGAINIQKCLRRMFARNRVEALRQRNKYQRLFDACIVLQKMFRGKVRRWKYVSFKRRKLEDKSVRILQRVQRGHKARRRCRVLRLHRDKGRAATMIQALVRGRISRKRAQKAKKEHGRLKSCIKIQAVIRGFITRRRATAVQRMMKKIKATIKIQKMIRGAICRMNMAAKRAELIAYKEIRETAAIKMQATVRGFCAKQRVKLMNIKKIRRMRKQNDAATKINCLVRRFNAKRLLKRMRRARMDLWLRDARTWIEMWSDDSKQFFYLNSQSGDALWEPPPVGYTRSTDKMLVLANGNVIEDPRFAKKDDQQEDQDSYQRLCSECTDRVAIRQCNECGDRFCTKCYKSLHATGSRRKHTFKPLGPIDCTECESLLAERWCVACDEAFCDPCWRKVHARGKRRFHPYSEVSPEGKVDQRVFTMDGEQVDDYDPTYSQQRLEGEEGNADNYGQTAAGYGETAAGYGEEWTQYEDEEGNPYYYNNFTGESTYDYPY